MDLVLHQIQTISRQGFASLSKMQPLLLRVLFLGITTTIGGMLNMHWTILVSVLLLGFIQLERYIAKASKAKTKMRTVLASKQIIRDLYNKYDFIEKVKVDYLDTSIQIKNIELTVYTMVYVEAFQQQYLQKIRQRLIAKHNFKEVSIHFVVID